MMTVITKKLLPQIEVLQQRALNSVYPMAFIDAIVFNVGDINMIRKAAGVRGDGHQCGKTTRIC